MKVGVVVALLAWLAVASTAAAPKIQKPGADRVLVTRIEGPISPIADEALGQALARRPIFP